MAGAARHIQIPADNPDFLERLADFLEQDSSAPDARYAARCREAADTLRQTLLPTIPQLVLWRILSPMGHRRQHSHE